ncbi:MAG: ATP-dependent Clp protease ATP-binding subunit [bacterium]|nr:ATP-dependent Clp protease ATP-binding subunit [bacterium]
MTIEELIHEERFYRPAILLDRYLRRASRHFVRAILSGAVAILFILIVVADLGPASGLGPVLPLFQGLFLIVLAVTVFSYVLEAFYNSYYFSDISTTVPEVAWTRPKISFSLALVLSDAKRFGLLHGFVLSPVGYEILERLGLSSEAIAKLVEGEEEDVSFEVGAREGMVTVGEYADALLNARKSFQNFLAAQEVSREHLLGASEWVEHALASEKRRLRWWGRDNLLKIPSIGVNWAYGQIYLLEKYGTEITSTGLYRALRENNLHAAELQELELILSKSNEANALLVGREGVGKMEIVAKLADNIMKETVSGELSGKRVIALDPTALVAATGSKEKFEREFIKLFNQASEAGNVIAVIENLPAFIKSAEALGSDASALLDPYLDSAALQVIAFADPRAFHSFIEKNGVLMNRFEKVQVKEGDTSALVRSLEDGVLAIERISGSFFTYQALVAVAESAERYFSQSVPTDAARDLLYEIAPYMERQGKRVVERSDVLELVEAKTGVPVGGVKEKEKSKLLDLERLLHERIVGQDEAVRAIANAMRRARSGMTNPNRPMGSFLFLGPTGVGKTETTKTLAEVFFGSEDHILRFDMSEFSALDALTRLIGSFEGGEPGILASTLRDKPYGVLLLDEFEKASTEVHNLFLQILDEGFFTDASGAHVNARNTIIIATANAGSDLIWHYLRDGKKLAEMKDVIVEALISRGIFKPELLNRFDGVILFHPLGETDLKEVATHMLGGLNERLRAKGLELEVNDALVNFLVKEGSHPEFGARPLNRAIQDVIEERIARKILAGEAKPGSKIVLEEAELSR